MDTEQRRATVLAEIYAAGNTGISGQVLAERLGVSRTAIHRHVETLRRHHVDIQAFKDGYRLAPDADPVAAHHVTRQLAETEHHGIVMGPVTWSANSASTNDDAIAAARRGAPDGTVIGTDHQLAGRGRRGRAWESNARTGLLFSVVQRTTAVGIAAGGSTPPPHPPFPILAALAVATAIGPTARIVWPNDIVINDTKVAGILCESTSDELGLAFAVIGTGINVTHTPEIANPRWPPGCLNDHGITIRRTELLTRVLTELRNERTRWDADPSALPRRYQPLDRLAGTAITIETARGPVVGIADGIDAAGALRLQHGGTSHVVHAGEVTSLQPSR